MVPANQHSLADALQSLLRGEIPLLSQDIDGRLQADGPLPRALLCGSFNPFHRGHHALAEVAARRLAVPVEFELGVVNADKPPLAVADVRQRLRQFVGTAPIWLTRTPTFAAKARLFPGVTFVVGVDTAERIISPRFYGDSVEHMLAALADVRAAGSRFLVAGRTDSTAQFIASESLILPESFRDLFNLIPESEFRFDVSSTQLRG
jgi:hypothetical protein